MDIPGSAIVFRQRLSELFDAEEYSVEKFCTLLRENNIVIAGSAPLQALLGEAWPSSDIDIWIDPENRDRSFRRLSAFLTLAGCQKIRQINFCKMFSEYARLRNQVSEIYATKLHGITIQIVICKIPVLEVVSNFDLTICNVFFDGEVIHVSDETRADIETKTLTTNGVVQNPMEWLRTVKRMIKYYKRGFTNIDYVKINRDLTESQVRDNMEVGLPEDMIKRFIDVVYVNVHPERALRRLFIPRIVPSGVGDLNVVNLFPGEEAEVADVFGLDNDARPEGGGDVPVVEVPDGEGHINVVERADNVLRNGIIAEDCPSFFENVIGHFEEGAVLADDIRKMVLAWNLIVNEEHLDLPIFYIDGSMVYLYDEENGEVLTSHDFGTDLNRELVPGDFPPEPERAEEIKIDTCFDFVAYDENADMVEYMRNKRGMGIMYRDKVYCVEFTQFRKLFDKYKDVPAEGEEAKTRWNRTQEVFFECKNGTPSIDRPYVLLRLTANFLVPLFDIRVVIKAFMDKRTRFFRLIDTGERIDLTASLGSALHLSGLLKRRAGRSAPVDAFVSADHCQAGSDKQVYRLVPVIQI